MDYKQRFKTICKTHIKRDGIDKLLEMLDKTDFYIAPASTKYHGAFESGLVQHSLEVFDILTTDTDANDCGIKMESLAIVSLFHDLCKMGFYKIEMRNAKDERGLWVKVPYYTVDDLYPYGHGCKSVDLLRDFMVLTQDEKLAINAHMGGFDERKNVVSNTFSICPLAVHLHVADLKATYNGK